MVRKIVSDNLPQVKVVCEGFGQMIVSYDLDKKSAIADGSGFRCWGVVGESNDLISNGDDITTNYLEVAIVKVLQSKGITVNDIWPYPINRSFVLIEDNIRHLGSKMEETQ